MTNTLTDYSPIIDILEDILGEERSHSEHSGQISFDCPVCSYEIKGLDHGDGKGNLEINYKEKVYKCWSCGETNDTHGKLRWFIKKFGSPRHLKQYDIFMPEDEDEPHAVIHKRVRLPEEFIPFNTPSLGIKLTHYYKQALNYVKSRHITDEMITKYNIGFCYQGLYVNRIIIPSYDEKNRVNYFIARSYETKPFRKYRNPKAEKEIIIWNEHLIDWDKPVYIVEGVFDSIFLPNSIPLLGKTIGEHLFNLIYNNGKEIVVVLDGDAHENTIKIYNKLNGGKLFGKIWAIFLPEDKDIADLEGQLNNYEKIQL
jgi:hypothetical protein